jgi:hypothetical protein
VDNMTRDEPSLGVEGRIPRGDVLRGAPGAPGASEPAKSRNPTSTHDVLDRVDRAIAYVARWVLVLLFVVLAARCALAADVTSGVVKIVFGGVSGWLAFRRR